MSIEILNKAVNSRDIIDRQLLLERQDAIERLAISGTYYPIALRAQNLVNLAGSANRYLFFPFTPTDTIVASNISINVSTGAAGQSYTVYLFNSNATTGLPNGQIFRTPTLSGATPTGLKTTSTVQYKSDFSTNYNLNTFKLIQHKKYWLGVYCNSSTGNILATPATAHPQISYGNSAYRVIASYNVAIDTMDDLNQTITAVSSAIPAIYFLIQ